VSQSLGEIVTDIEYPESVDTGWIGPTRAVIGLVQGLALYLLFDAYQSKAWPATDGAVFVALCTIAIFVPLILASALTHLRPGLLIGWTFWVALICAVLAWYDIYRDPFSSPAVPRNLPSPQLWLALALGLFVGHALLISGAGDRRLIAHYPTYFGISWKHGLQAVMAALFTGIFWLVLWLGADLFKLIKIDFLYELIRKNWFWIPATTVALNYAIHVTDVRVGIVRGMRTLSCNLLSWLLPLLTLIAVGFVVALAFTGMEPLWNTRRASSILLTAAASLIFLINSAYQDGARIYGGGDGVRPLPLLLRVAVKAASAVLIPLVLLAAYGIWLRVSQYGWTPQRVIATASAMVAACYALGYAVAAITPSRSVFRLETTNVATAFVVLAVLCALYTPAADPARISVEDQLRRLNAGTISQDQLDYVFLRFGAGRFGNDALQKLADQPTLKPAAEKAAEALQKKNRFEAVRPVARISVDERRKNITVARPQGQSLPSEFVEADWNNFPRTYQLPQCLIDRVKCDAVLLDFDGDGINEIIVVPSAGQATVFRMGNNRLWSYLGLLAGSNCLGMRDSLLAGTFEVAQSAFKELNVSGNRLRLAMLPDCTSNPTLSPSKR
jgi:hypothetical protein